jgi:RNase P/RNase MRP subunit p30
VEHDWQVFHRWIDLLAIDGGRLRMALASVASHHVDILPALDLRSLRNVSIEMPNAR